MPIRNSRILSVWCRHKYTYVAHTAVKPGWRTIFCWQGCDITLSQNMYKNLLAPFYSNSNYGNFIQMITILLYLNLLFGHGLEIYNPPCCYFLGYCPLVNVQIDYCAQIFHLSKIGPKFAPSFAFIHGSSVC